MVDSSVTTTQVDRGRVLVMDDEKMIRDNTRKMLTCLGYQAECVGDGKEAIAQYVRARESNQPFEAVILDLNIPSGIGGTEVIRSLKAIDPEVKAILASGDLGNPVLEDFEKYGFSRAIAKPFSLSDLSEALNAISSQV